MADGKEDDEKILKKGSSNLTLGIPVGAVPRPAPPSREKPKRKDSERGNLFSFLAKTEKDDEGEEEVDSQWEWSDFTCGMKLFCSVKSPTTFRYSQHVNDLIHIAVFGGLAALFYFTPGLNTSSVSVLSNEVYSWFFAATILCSTIYVGMRLQAFAVWFVQRFVRNADIWPIYFAAMAFSTSIALLTTSIVALAVWPEILDFDSSTNDLINEILTSILLVTIGHIIRKYITQRIIMKFNEQAYLKRVEDFQFKELVIHEISTLREGDIGYEQQTASPSAKTRTKNSNVGSVDLTAHLPRGDLTRFTQLVADMQARGQLDNPNDGTIGASGPSNAGTIYTASKDQDDDEQREEQLRVVHRSGNAKDSSDRPAPRAFFRFHRALRRSQLDQQCYDTQVAIWKKLDVDRKGYLVLADFERVFTVETAKRAWDTLRLSHDETLSKAEMRQSLRGFYKERTNLTRSLNNFENLARVVKMLINFIFWLVMIIIVLLVLGVAVSNLLITFGTLMVSVSFALGNSIKNVVESMIFLLVNKPYDVGDRVQIGEQDADPVRLWVISINLMTTTFKSIYGKVMIMPNYVLATMPITNLKRSPNAVVVVSLEIDFHTSVAKLEKLYSMVQDFVRNHPVYWKPEVDWYAEALWQTNMMDLSFWLTSTLDWAEVGQLFQAKSDLLHEIRKDMDQLNITWLPAKQTYLVDKKSKTMPRAEGLSSESSAI